MDLLAGTGPKKARFWRGLEWSIPPFQPGCDTPIFGVCFSGIFFGCGFALYDFCDRSRVVWGEGVDLGGRGII